MPPRKPRAPTPPITAPSPPLPTPSLSSAYLRMSYRIARGEQGVLTFEPYKSLVLPFWRFKTVDIAKQSSVALKEVFDSYVERSDFVGADMTRKFIQMGMTRAKRYANHAGGKKYGKGKVDGERGEELPKSESHAGRNEKLEASEIFKVVWRKCTSDEEYLRLKKEFQEEQKMWDNKQKGARNEDDQLGIKEETNVKEEEIDDG